MKYQAADNIYYRTINLSKAYKGVQALKDFNLKLAPGILGLLGPNGAGKSTLMRMLATITKPTEVTILAVAAVIMVLLQSETALDPGALLMPFLAVVLPNMALIAALAVVFETVPWLRGAAGNAVYLLAAAGLLLSAYWRGRQVRV